MVALPAAASTAAIVASVAAAAVSAAAAIQQGQNQAALAKYNSDVQQQDAKQAMDAANANAQLQQTRGAALLAQQKAAFASGGVDVDSGSPLAVMSDTANQTALDAATIRYGGTISSQRAQSQSGLDLTQGQMAVQGSYFSAGSSLLSGAARAYGNRATPPTDPTLSGVPGGPPTSPQMVGGVVKY